MQILKTILRHIYYYTPFKKYFFLVLRKFYKPSPPMVRRLRFKGIIKLQCNNNSFILRHYGYPVENDLFWNGIGKGWEKKSLQIWSELVYQANTVLDIGANTGIYSLIAKTLNPHARIWAFEPVKRVHEKLQYNCKLNGYDIQCENYALSNYNGSGII